NNLTISPPVGLLTNQKEEHFDCATKDLISRIIGRFQRDPH
ncbi:LysR family transcriptional regulator, partial [Bacillus velezensis]